MTMLRFRPITRADYPLVASWLEQPQVRRWWCDDSAMDAIEREYGGVIDGTEPAHVFIAEADGGTPFALIQRFRLDDFPRYRDEVGTVYAAPPRASSIDYFIGPPKRIGAGWGRRLLREFTTSIWRDDPGTPCIVVPTHADNAASWRTLESAGYRRVATGDLEPDNPADSPRHHVYRIDRPADLTRPPAPPPP